MRYGIRDMMHNIKYICIYYIWHFLVCFAIGKVVQNGRWWLLLGRWWLLLVLVLVLVFGWLLVALSGFGVWVVVGSSF
jgi:hypothetical protein